MSRTIRLHVTIDTIRVTGADLVHKHALAPAIESRLKAMLPETGADFNTSCQFSLASVSAEPLSYQGHIRHAQLGEGIARQVVRSIVPVQSRNDANANGKGDA